MEAVLTIEVFQDGELVDEGQTTLSKEDWIKLDVQLRDPKLREFFGLEPLEVDPLLEMADQCGEPPTLLLAVPGAKKS